MIEQESEPHFRSLEGLLELLDQIFKIAMINIVGGRKKKVDKGENRWVIQAGRWK